MDKIKHYSLTAPASIYDEEALTALELAGRTAAKVNEAVDAFNELEASVPVQIAEDVKKHIEAGDFDEQISEHLGDLNGRVDNLLGSVPVGGTSMDAEIVDARRNVFGNNIQNLGNRLRVLESEIAIAANGHGYVGGNGRMQIFADGATGEIRVHFDKPITVKLPIAGVETGSGWGNYREIYELDDESKHDGGASIRIPAYNALVYRHYDKDGNAYESDQEGLTVVALTSLHGGDLLLLANSWARPVGGKLLELETHELAKATDARVEMIDETLKASVYVSARGAITFEEYKSATDGGLKISFGDRLTVRDENGVNGYDWSEIGSELGSNIAIEGNKATITLPMSNRVLALNLETKKLKIYGSHLALGSSDLVLVHNAWSTPTGGILVDMATRQTAEKALKLAEQGGGGGSSTPAVPAYELPYDAIARHAVKVAANTSQKPQTFLFFTDPHLCEGDDWRANFEDKLGYIKAVYDASAVDFIVCGGDWLGNADTKEEAIEKLAYIDARTRALFGDNFYHVLGNHDTNYQGSSEREAGVAAGNYDARLTHDQIVNLLFRREKDCKYSFVRNNTRYIILNTLTDWYDDVADTNEDWCIDGSDGADVEHHMGVIRFLIEELTANESEDVIVIQHIPTYTNADGTISSTITNLCNTFNQRSSTYIDDYTYLEADGNTFKGYVRAIIGGHEHKDTTKNAKIAHPYGPAVMWTTNLLAGGVPTFDLVTINTANKILNTTRIGTGADREITLYN